MIQNVSILCFLSIVGYLAQHVLFRDQGLALVTSPRRNDIAGDFKDSTVLIGAGVQGVGLGFRVV